jgi:HEAT repeat protein
LPLLEPLLQDQQPQPRRVAARALGRIGGAAVVPLLKKALQDGDAAVRVAAAGSLAQALAGLR